jgi:hypothetical protein
LYQLPRMNFSPATFENENVCLIEVCLNLCFCVIFCRMFTTLVNQCLVRNRRILL